MLLKLIAPLLLLTVVSCASIDQTSNITKSSNKHDVTITNTTLINENHIYEIQQNTSLIKFRVDSPVGEVWGSFDDLKGSFTLLNNGENNQSATVDVNTESLRAGNFIIESMLKGEKFFNVDRYPSMHFDGASFEWFNDKNAVLKGYLTMNNVTQPVAFYVELVKLNSAAPNSKSITVKAETTIRRSEFGLDSMLPAISDNVNLFMEIDALRKNTTVSMK